MNVSQLKRLIATFLLCTCLINVGCSITETPTSNNEGRASNTQESTVNKATSSANEEVPSQPSNQKKVKCDLTVPAKLKEITDRINKTDFPHLYKLTQNSKLYFKADSEHDLHVYGVAFNRSNVILEVRKLVKGFEGTDCVAGIYFSKSDSRNANTFRMSVCDFECEDGTCSDDPECKKDTPVPTPTP